MNLIDFYKKISSDSNDKAARNAKFFSEEVTMYNILNATFKDEDIETIKMSPSISNPIFDVTFKNENIASNAEGNLNKQIVPGAYKPLYEINIEKKEKTLSFNLNEV